ncbi:hypothetical protein BH11PSE9_BH11PSE9_29540 [soil metagenome]
MKLDADLIDACACIAFGMVSATALGWFYAETILCNPESNWGSASRTVWAVIRCRLGI